MPAPTWALAGHTSQLGYAGLGRIATGSKYILPSSGGAMGGAGRLLRVSFDHFAEGAIPKPGILWGFPVNPIVEVDDPGEWYDHGAINPLPVFGVVNGLPYGAGVLVNPLNTTPTGPASILDARGEQYPASTKYAKLREYGLTVKANLKVPVNRCLYVAMLCRIGGDGQILMIDKIRETAEYNSLAYRTFPDVIRPLLNIYTRSGAVHVDDSNTWIRAESVNHAIPYNKWILLVYLRTPSQAEFTAVMPSGVVAGDYTETYSGWRGPMVDTAILPYLSTPDVMSMQKTTAVVSGTYSLLQKGLPCFLTINGFRSANFLSDVQLTEKASQSLAPAMVDVAWAEVGVGDFEGIWKTSAGRNPRSFVMFMHDLTHSYLAATGLESSYSAPAPENAPRSTALFAEVVKRSPTGTDDEGIPLADPVAVASISAETARTAEDTSVALTSLAVEVIRLNTERVRRETVNLRIGASASAQLVRAGSFGSGSSSVLIGVSASQFASRPVGVSASTGVRISSLARNPLTFVVSASTRVALLQSASKTISRLGEASSGISIGAASSARSIRSASALSHIAIGARSHPNRPYLNIDLSAESRLLLSADGDTIGRPRLAAAVTELRIGSGSSKVANLSAIALSSVGVRGFGHSTTGLLRVSAFSVAAFLARSSAGTPRVVSSSASSGLFVGGSAAARSPVLQASARSNVRVSALAGHMAAVSIPVSAATRVAVRQSSLVRRIAILPQIDSSSMVLRAAVSAHVVRLIHASAETAVILGQDLSVSAERVISPATESSIVIISAAEASTAARRHASAETGVRVLARCGEASSRGVSARTEIAISASSSETRNAAAPAASVVSISSIAAESLAVNSSASSSILVRDSALGIAPARGTASSAVSVSGDADAVVQRLGGYLSLVISCVASSVVERSPGRNGIRRVAGQTKCASLFSYDFAPSGVAILASGIDHAMAWDPTSCSVRRAGVPQPGGGMVASGFGAGVLTGTRLAYVRFVREDGSTGPLSPVCPSFDLGRDGAIDDAAVSADGTLVICSYDHELKTGDQVTLVDTGFPVRSAVISVVSKDHFALAGIHVPSMPWSGTGSWVLGSSEVVYNNVPPAPDGVSRRQILRSLDGAPEVVYVDVDTDDLVSPQLISRKSDPELMVGAFVPLLDPDGVPVGRRNSPPPTHKPIVCAHGGLLYAAGEREVSEGCVHVSVGHNTIKGVATRWSDALVGREVSIRGSASRYVIVGMDVENQIATLSSPVVGSPPPFALYSITPAQSERSLVYYCEPGQPEWWPKWNVFSVPPEAGVPTAMRSSSGSLHIFCESSVYRLSYSTDPGRDGVLRHIAARGAVNHKCVAEAAGSVFALDREGIYALTDSGVIPISSPIAAIMTSDPWTPSLDWSTSHAWHACYDSASGVVRWFVTLVGGGYMRSALSYRVDGGRWWLEEYPVPILCSDEARLGRIRPIVGSEARMVCVLDEGTTDIVPESDAAPVVVVGSSWDRLVADRDLPSSLVGAPVTVVSGPATGFRSTVTEVSGPSAILLRPWDVEPEPGDIVQVGGVPWSWKSGMLESRSHSGGIQQDITIHYMPTSHSSIMKVEPYEGSSSDPAAMVGDGVDRDGVRVSEHGIFVDMARSSREGVFVQRLHTHSDQRSYGAAHRAVRLSGVQGADRVRVFGLQLAGTGA